MGIHLEEGEHEIRMTYTPEGLWEGSALSLLCALLFFLTGIWEKRHPAWFASKDPQNGEDQGESQRGQEMENNLEDEEMTLAFWENELEYEGDRENER